MSDPREKGREPVHVSSFAPTTREWRKWVERRLTDATELLSSAYGARDNGRGVHEERILISEPYIFAAAIDTDDRLVGCFYLHREGKHGAIGVDPRVQRRGVGTALLRASLKAVPDQWAEVAVSDDRYSSVLTRAGFTAAHRQRDILTLLGPLLEPLTSGWSLNAEGLTYERASFSSGKRGVARYRLFSTGCPQPREHNDGRYYLAPPLSPADVEDPEGPPGLA